MPHTRERALAIAQAALRREQARRRVERACQDLVAVLDDNALRPHYRAFERDARADLVRAECLYTSSLCDA